MSVGPRGRSEGILVERLEDGLVIFDTRTDQAHSLDGAAAAVWSAADGTRTVSEIAETTGVGEVGVLAALEMLGGRDLLVTVGPLARSLGDGFDGEVRGTGDAAEAAALVPELLEPGDVVLVKASNGVGLELVCKALEARGAG